jgi:hypothetical protein
VNRDRLPNFLIIGAPKAGTTSLHYYLDQHPEISMSSKKETKFFLRNDYLEGLPEYERYFADGLARGEATPKYALFPTIAHVPERIHSVLPDAKLIYLVRDPIDRAEAYFHQRYCSTQDLRSIAAAFSDLEDPRNMYVSSSKYAMQTDQYMRYFPRSNLMIVDNHDLRWARQATLSSIFSFLGVDPDFRSPRFDEELHTQHELPQLTRTGRKLLSSPIANAARRMLPRRVRKPLYAIAHQRLSRANVERQLLPPDLRRRLAEVLREDVERFREFTNRSFDHWSV